MLRHTVIPTFGTYAATANSEFLRDGSTRTGRQSPTWIRFPAAAGEVFQG